MGLLSALKKLFSGRQKTVPDDGSGLFRTCVETDGKTFVIGEPFHAASAYEAAIETRERAEIFMVQMAMKTKDMGFARYWTERYGGPHAKME